MAQFKQQLLNLNSSGGELDWDYSLPSWLNCRVLSGTHRDLGEKYRAILDNILTHGEDELVEGLKIFIEAIVNENVSLVISRQLLSEVGNTLAQLEDSVSKAVSHFTIDIVQPRVISFEDQVVTIRTHLADIYEREQNWSEAGKVLVGIPLETGQKQYSVDFKLETYLKIARWVGLSLSYQWWILNISGEPTKITIGTMST